MEIMVLDKKKIEKIIVLIIFILAALFLFDRSKYGYIYNDEPFILTLSHRLVKGDVFMYDEWQPTQLTGFLNYPWMLLFTLTHSNTDGMILFFRHLYVILNTLAIFFMYYRLSKYNQKKWITCGACLYLMLFSAMDIMTLSYNFYSLIGLTLFLTLMITGSGKRNAFVAGIFFSIATLASPYLAILFVIYYLMYAIYRYILKKERTERVDTTTTYVLFGVLACVLVFIIFLYATGGSISKMLSTLKYIFTDAEYPSKSLFQLIYGYIYTWIKKFRTFGFIFIVFLIISIIDKKHRLRWFELHLLVFVLLMPRMIHVFKYQFNYLTVQVALLGLHALIVDDKRNKCYSLAYISGWVFSFVIFATSDLKQYALALGLTLSGFVSFFLIEDYLSKNEKVNITKILCVLLVCTQIGTEVYTRNHRYYLDQNTSDNTYMITESVAKGIYAKKKSYDSYNEILDEIQTNVPSHSKLLVLSQEPWIYLANDSEYCTYSAWMTNNKKFKLRRLKEYYKIHEDKKPEYIYASKEDFKLKELQKEFPNFILISSHKGYILKEKDS